MLCWMFLLNRRYKAVLLHRKHPNLKWTTASFSPRSGVYLLSALVRPRRSQSATVVEDTVTSTSISPHSSQHNRWPGGRRNTEGERQGKHHHLFSDIFCPPRSVLLQRATNQMRYGYVKVERVLLLTRFWNSLRSMILCLLPGGFKQSHTLLDKQDKEDVTVSFTAVLQIFPIHRSAKRMWAV